MLLARCAAAIAVATQAVAAVQLQLADAKSVFVILADRLAMQLQAVVAKSTLAILADATADVDASPVCFPSCSRRSHAVTLVAILAAAHAPAVAPAVATAVADRPAHLLQLRLYQATLLQCLQHQLLTQVLT